MRLFVAINLPDAEKKRMSRALAALPAEELSIRWVEADSLHITVKFLGEVAESRLHEVEVALENAAAGAGVLDIVVSGLGAFPSLARPNIVWVGVQAGPEMGELQRRIDSAFAAIGFPPEDRAFRPHITVARVRKDGRIRDRQVMDRIKASFEYKAEVRVESVDLMRSRLGSSGARYEALQRVELH